MWRAQKLCGTIGTLPSGFFTGGTMLRLELIAMLVLAVLVAGCGGEGGAAAGPGAGRPRTALIQVATVTRDVVEPTTTAVGTVVARRTSIVASGADGKVDQFLVREGDVVAEGQELSVLNMVTTNLEIAEAEALLQEREQEYLAAQTSRPLEIDEARARMDAAAVARDVAAERLTRWERLAESGAANHDTVDEARERSQAAEKMFLAAKAAHDLVFAGPRDETKLQARAHRDAQQQRVDYLKAERDKRTTRAPFRGIVVLEHTEAGQWLSKDAPVVTLADLLDAVEIMANVDQRDLANVQIGANVRVTVEGVTPLEWTGCVTSVVPRSEWESGSRMFPVRVTVSNQTVEIDGRVQPVLREGMLARLTFAGPSHEATLVPKNALIRSETNTRLYAVVSGEQPNTGKARPVVVQEAGSYGDRVEVLGQDLQAGMLVVTEGAERLTPFADIQIQPDAAQGTPPTGAGAAHQAGDAQPQPAPSDKGPAADPPAQKPAA